MQFHAVSADILNRRCTAGAGNQGQILDAPETFFCAGQYQAMPVTTTVSADLTAIFVLETYCIGSQPEDGAGEIACEKQIAAVTQRQERCGKFSASKLDGGGYAGGVTNFNQRRGMYPYAKGVQVGQGPVSRDFIERIHEVARQPERDRGK